MATPDRAGGLRHAARLFEGLFRFPLFYKILIANVIIVLVGATAGTALTVAFVRAVPTRSTLQLVGMFAAAGVLVSVVVNVIILRLALRPLERLEETAGRVQRGDVDARALPSRLSDANMIRLTQTFNRMLDSLAAHRQWLQDWAARARHAEESERKRIAQELHDETAQTLAALIVRMRVARGADDRAVLEQRLEEIRDELADTLENIRRFAKGLRPPALDELGVVAALREHVESVCEVTDLRIDVEADPIDAFLSEDGELALYRIVQEALTNVLRHAAARAVHVRIARGGEGVVAQVTDDGRGFVVTESTDRSSGHFGIFGMRERAAYVGGRVDVRSQPGKGTTVRVEIPVDRWGNLG